MPPSHRLVGARHEHRTADCVWDPRHWAWRLVPAARQVLAVLGALARQPAPVPAGVLVRELGLPRSTVYHLLRELTDAGFAVHLPEERRYGLGVGALELGTAYMRQEPLARLARPVLARLVDRVGESAHLAVLHGREVLYVVEERAPGPAVPGDGRRRPPARAADGERPGDARRAPAGAGAGPVPRTRRPSSTGTGIGPRSLSALRRILVEVRRWDMPTEDGEVTPGFASVAAAAHDHTGLPVAGLAVTFPSQPGTDAERPGRERLARAATTAAAELTRRLGGHPPSVTGGGIGARA